MPIRVRGLGLAGVNVDVNPLDLPENAFTSAQNAIHDKRGVEGGLRKRRGLIERNTSTAAGSVLGAIGVPLPFEGTPNNNSYVFSSSLTTTSATMTSASGLAVGDLFWWITSTGIIQGTQPRTITSLSGNDIEWLPPFSSAPSANDYLIPSPVRLVYQGLIDESSGDPGWAVSVDQFTSVTLTNDTDANPEDPRDVTAGASSGFVHAGQYFRASVVLNNKLYYASDNYTIGTNHPPVRVWDGFEDREICRIPTNHDVSSTNVPIGVIAMTTGRYNGEANPVIFLSTVDTGNSSGSTNKGRVFVLFPNTGQLLALGSTFTVKHNPSALLYAFGRLWVGTQGGGNETGFQATVQYIRPGIDTSFTTDNTFTAGYDMVTSLASFQGALYASTQSNDATQQAAVFKRTMSSGSWASVEAASGETNKHGYISLLVYNNLLLATKWVSSTAAALIRKTSDGSTWSTAFTASTAAQKVPMVLNVDGTSSTSKAYATGVTDSGPLLLTTSDGTTWSDQTSTIPNSASTITTNLFGSLTL